MPRFTPSRPCIVHRCPNYTTGTRCEEHEAEAKKLGASGSGTTAAWRRARKIALERTGYRCERCGRTQEQARADGTHLEVHHVDGRGVGALHHDQAKLRVLCRTPCHTATLRATPRKTPHQRMLDQQAEIRERAQARRRQREQAGTRT